ncbi:MAG: substrate-binding domain-containing protein, partial [Roseiflexaceae bacterium]|nr:substrate-binding domain-containing protein [Roseiflexaceae bacterium]
NIWYGTEKKEWLEDAVKRFEATNPREGRRPIQVELRGIGSRAIPLRTAQEQWGEDGQPTVISPASSMWVELLRTEWAARHPNQPNIIAAGDAAPQPLALTPLVIVAWEQRARVLWGDDTSTFWDTLHRALANPKGWVGVAEQRGFAVGSPEYTQAQQWGFVKFGHTSPLTSNSGAQTLMLLAYAYHNKSSGLTSADITDPAFQKWLLEVETAVLEFGDSTGTFMTNMVQFGPSKYDVVAVYENVAIENIQAAQGRWGQDIKIYYPPATMFSDHPYAVLDAPWTTPEQRAAAVQFRNFLLSRPIQELALQSYGFRPADPNVPLLTNDANNPFNKYKTYGVKVDIAQQVQTPTGDVVSTLLDLWRRQINR